MSTVTEMSLLREETESFASRHRQDAEAEVQQRLQQLASEEETAQRARAQAQARHDEELASLRENAQREADDLMAAAQSHLTWAQRTVAEIVQTTERDNEAARRAHHQALSARTQSHRERAATLLASARAKSADRLSEADSEADRMRSLAAAVLAEAQADASRTRQHAEREAENLLEVAKAQASEALDRADRRLAEAEGGARLVRERAAEDIERLHREAHESHRAARAEIVRETEEARRVSTTLRAEAQAAVERARAEVHLLAARRDDITAQLGNLSGVIEALSVNELANTDHRQSEDEIVPDTTSPQEP